MLSRTSFCRVLRAGLLIVTTALRYSWLLCRSKIPGFRPSEEAWERAHRRTGRGIYRLATRLGGAFIKLGQVLGARADFFPASLVEPLARLHDRVPARPFRSLRAQVERDLGRPLGEVFSDVAEQPIAAASLAQVHRARLIGGEEVVIKVQYPEVAKLFPTDLASLRRAVRVARWLKRGLDLRPMAEEAAVFIGLELDFEREAESTERVRVVFQDSAVVRIPRVHFAGPRVLVLEYIAGIGVANGEALDAAGFGRRVIAQRIASLYCAMLFEHGFFHGDPHPGNILVCPDGKIGLLDFGLAKELPRGFGGAVATMILSAMVGDGAGALSAAREIGFDLDGEDPRLLLELIRIMLGDYAGSGAIRKQIKAGALRSIPGHIALVARTLVLLNGLSHLLVPGERVIATALTGALGRRMTNSAAADSAPSERAIAARLTGAETHGTPGGPPVAHQ